MTPSRAHRSSLRRRVIRMQNSSTPYPIVCSADKVEARFGRSAATTFAVLRRYFVPVWVALATARAQAAKLGSTYPGGFSCAPFRRVRSERDLLLVLDGGLALA